MIYPGLGKSTESKKSRANSHEKRIAKQLKARRQPNSGATAIAKGDVKTPEILIDSKTTIDSKITVTAEMLAKITLEARQQGREPAIQISLKVGCTTPQDWLLLPLDYYGGLMYEVTNLRRQVRGLKHASGSDDYAGEAETSE